MNSGRILLTCLQGFTTHAQHQQMQQQGWGLWLLTDLVSCSVSVTVNRVGGALPGRQAAIKLAREFGFLVDDTGNLKGWRPLPKDDVELDHDGRRIEPLRWIMTPNGPQPVGGLNPQELRKRRRNA